MLLTFQASAFDHSATSPRKTHTRSTRARKGTGGRPGDQIGRLAAALGILVLYGALATVPMSGRTGDEWLPVLVCWGARRSGPR